MTVDMALRLWRRGEPVPVANAPTLMKPLETHAVGGDVLEVHPDGSGTYKLILVRKGDQREEVRGVRR